MKGRPIKVDIRDRDGRSVKVEEDIWDEEFWEKKLGQVPEDFIRGIILRKFPGSENIVYDDDVRVWTWEYQTLCMQLYLHDPQPWFVLEVWKYLEEKK